jgi:hypothetical protein
MASPAVTFPKARTSRQIAQGDGIQTKSTESGMVPAKGTRTEAAAKAMTSMAGVARSQRLLSQPIEHGTDAIGQLVCRLVFINSDDTECCDTIENGPDLTA